jgi:hypothetical protein
MSGTISRSFDPICEKAAKKPTRSTNDEQKYSEYRQGDNLLGACG